MNFKDLKIGHYLYILNRETIEVQKGCVTNITAPHVEAKMGNPCQLVVDVTVNVNGNPVTYVAQDSVSATFCGNLVISCDKDYILSDIKGIRSGCEQIIKNLSNTKEKMSRCDTAISDLDDAFREKQLMENRLQSIEEGQKEMRELIKQFINKKSL